MLSLLTRRSISREWKPVLGLQVAMPQRPQRTRRAFEILLRHLMDRLRQNELISVDGDLSRALQTAWAAALPQLVVTLILFPMYHRFKPGAPRRGFWPQVGDHYFFVLYAIFVMGTVTVYSWDLLFPDAVDVFVLQPLPVRGRRLLAARAAAVSLFLAAVLLGTSALGMIFFPAAVDMPQLGWHYTAHFTAVTMAGIFSASVLLLLQGVLLNLVSERVFQRLTPLLQGGSILLLFSALFAFPKMVASLPSLMQGGARWVLWFPPFWFLGIYDRLLHGPQGLPIFAELAWRGLWATLLVIVGVAITYPTAYARKVRLTMEGSAATESGPGWWKGLDGLLHVAVRRPVMRGIFHFIAQTLLRARRPRTLLVMYASLGLALTAVTLLAVDNDGRGFRLLPEGMAQAIPMLVFWLVCGLRAAFASPVDLRGAWIFRVIRGRPGDEMLSVSRNWIVICAATVCAIALTALGAMGELTGLRFFVEMTVAVAAALLLTAFLFSKVESVPFTEAQKSLMQERPLAAVRYLVFFPMYVGFAAGWAWRLEHRWQSWLTFLALVSGGYLVLRWKGQRWRRWNFDGNTEADMDGFPQTLGLRE